MPPATSQGSELVDPIAVRPTLVREIASIRIDKANVITYVSCEVAMTTIELTEDESTRLEKIITGVLSELHSEIHHTDEKAFRAALKDDRAFLERLVQQLKAPTVKS